MPSLPLLRLRQALQFTKLQLGNVRDDMAIFAGRWTKGAALRQRGLSWSRMLVRADQDSGRFLYFYGGYEPEECACFQSMLRPSDVCIDIGANVGFYTLLFSQLAATGAVHAFEPVDANWHVLNINVLTNSLRNVTLNRAAVGDRDGEAEFTLASDPTYSSFVDTGRKPSAGCVRVPVITLDSYLRQQQIPRVDCLKVDVEGGEYKVLMGGTRLFNDPQRRPRLVMLELHDPMLQKQGSSIDQLVEQMGAFGYSPFVWAKDQRVAFRREHYMKYFNVFFSPE